LTTVQARFVEPIRVDASDAEAELLVIGIGAANGPIAEAVLKLRQDGVCVNHVRLRLLQPFPVEALEAEMAKARKIVIVEHNATSQLAALIRMHTKPAGRMHSVLKYDGNPFRPAEVAAGCKEVL